VCKTSVANNKPITLLSGIFWRHGIIFGLGTINLNYRVSRVEVVWGGYN